MVQQCEGAQLVEIELRKSLRRTDGLRIDGDGHVHHAVVRDAEDLRDEVWEDGEYADDALATDLDGVWWSGDVGEDDGVA